MKRSLDESLDDIAAAEIAENEVIRLAHLPDEDEFLETSENLKSKGEFKL